MRENELYSTNRIDFSLEDISKWSNEDSSVRIPALQRGLVWVPAQIELLWDSLMRGIPIGSFVLCDKIDSQNICEKNAEYDFHLLDGQQRANAIQLGYDNPFLGATNNVRENTKAILWLDLCPDIPATSSRDYLFRVTTVAHPWGYTKHDNAGVLQAEKIREAIRRVSHCEENAFDSTDYKRPKPIDLYPFEACCPIPMGVLWEIFNKWNNNNESEYDKLSDYITSFLKEKYSVFKWAENIYEKIGGTKDIISIWNGLATAKRTKILALKAPNNLLKPSKQENCIGINGSERITAIEHLFQRLNRQGTELNGEELIYSMIKAYWPQVRNAIDAIDNTNKLMPASRLVSIAMRVAKTECRSKWFDQNNIEPALNVTDIRKLTVEDFNNTESLHRCIIGYINNDLREDCQKVDKLLGLDSNSWGLPPVLRSSIAYKLSDAYLLLLLLIRKHQQSINEDISIALTGIVTWMKWFGGNVGKVSEALYSCKELNIQTIQGVVKGCVENEFLFPLFTPCELHNYLKLPCKSKTVSVTDDEFDSIVSQWNFESLYPEQGNHELNRRWGHFLERLKTEREILIYAQRHYIIRRFKEYDPSRKDFWRGYNRPWDYDHIFAKKYAYRQKSNNRFLFFCQKWRDTNGNMRAWPFEANRSDQAMQAKAKITEEQQIVDSYIVSDELDGFNVGGEAISDSAKALLFANSCRSRLIRIYCEWFYDLKIYRLLPWENPIEKHEQ